MTKNVIILDPPASSPDLNPTENVWGWKAKDVYKNGCHFQTVYDLREAIFTSWNKIPDYLFFSDAYIDHAKANFFKLFPMTAEVAHHLDTWLGIFY